MKKSYLIFFLLLSVLPPVCGAVDKISVTQGNAVLLDDPVGYDYVFVFADMTQAEIAYTGSGANPVWSEVTDLTHSVAMGVSEFSPQNATGYRLVAGSDTVTFFTFDYSQYAPVFRSLITDGTNAEPCKQVYLKLDADIPLMQYAAFRSGGQQTVQREFTLTYKSREWDEAAMEWKDTEVEQHWGQTWREAQFDAPLCDSHFNLAGDQLAQELGLTPYEVESPLYQAVRVEANMTTVTEKRDELNEDKRPTETSMSGSAPLNILFEANANEPVALHYDWRVEHQGALLIQRSDRELRHSFEKAGDYTVRLSVMSAAGCLDTTSVVVSVSESMLEVPNVFTPNGDGKNDEFRVVYRSLVDFHCRVYNRWGRRVYQWSDPSKGWDGTINGKPASPGPYFYAIQAKGSDDKEYKLNGDINLIGR